ncbi:hypothetical protein [Moorena sp. SIOASIH]|uniref:hypothetical protein n=1 Tax=Moorena sp. SIOASIH TaxID=2607817 RepID=UPI0025D2AC43|nr:hypothetical protein [Moorena sp. SIOASIH]
MYRKLKTLVSSLLFGLFVLTMSFSFGANPTFASPLAPEGYFFVQATNEAGVTETSTSFADVKVSFEGSGQWSYGDPQREFGACGDPEYAYQSGMTYPDKTSFSLIADCGSAGVYEVCDNTVITLAPAETCNFKMNDSPGGYYNNDGALIVSYNIFD